MDTTQQQNQQQLDPNVVNLAKAIRQKESGGNFQAKGKSGEYGAYQFTDGTWNSASQKYLGQQIPLQQSSPEQQNEVAYKQIKDWKDQGFNVGQISSMWNAGHGEPNAHLGTFSNGAPSVGKNKYGAHFDVPTYAKDVVTNYQKLKSPQEYQTGFNPDVFKYSPQPFSQPALADVSGTQQQQPQPQQPKKESVFSSPQAFLKGFGENVKQGVTSAGNFMFPVVSDVNDIFKGSVKKSPWQMVGDLGLSAASLIPFSGVAATALSTPLRGAALGYGVGTASNLSQGQSPLQAITPQVSNVVGGALGGAVPAVTGALRKLAAKASGIDPRVLDVLKNNDIPIEDYNKYIQAAEESSKNIKAPTPLTLAADEFDSAAKKITDLRSAAGSALGEIKKSSSDVPLNDVGNVISQFQNDIKDKFGLSIISDPNGKITLEQPESTLRQLAPSLKSRILNTANQLFGLIDGKIGDASDVSKNLGELIDYNVKDKYGNVVDPLAGTLTKTDGALRGLINDSSPDVAQANAQFAGLRNIEKEIKTMAGQRLQRGDLLMKRVFSGDKSGDVQDLFGKIKATTGIDLINHAVLAKHAIDTAGTQAQKTLLQQAIEGGISAHTAGIIPTLFNMGRGAIRSTIANPIAIGRQAITGVSNMLPSLLQQGGIRGGINSGNYLQNLITGKQSKSK